jgi:ribosomal 50S subunit-recycling heat shock protein
MRLDKFLKVSRIIKRRTIAKEVADQGRVQINGNVAKSSSSVNISDVLTIRYGNKTLQLKVTKITDSTKKEDATSMYEIINETYHKGDIT